MENQYDLDELQRSKEDLEQLVARHYKGQKKQKTLPAKLEEDFWKFNIDRTRINAIQFFGQGVITYTIFVLLILPSNYLVIRSSPHFIVDFVCLSKNLVIEVDGGYHNDPTQKEYDQQRTLYLSEKGFKVIRFTNEEVLGNTEAVLKEIKQELVLPLTLSKGGGTVAHNSNGSIEENQGGGTAAHNSDNINTTSPLSLGEGQGVRLLPHFHKASHSSLPVERGQGVRFLNTFIAYETFIQHPYRCRIALCRLTSHHGLWRKRHAGTHPRLPAKAGKRRL